MAKLNQELTSELGIEVKIIEGKTYEELVEIARQNNEERRLELLETRRRTGVMLCWNQNAIIIIDVNGNILLEPNGNVPSEPNGNVLREPIGSFRANSNYTSSITVIAPFELDSVVSANYSKRNRRNDDIAQFLIPNGNKKGKDIIGENDPLYQLVYDWHVFEADVPQLAVAYFRQIQK